MHGSALAHEREYLVGATPGRGIPGIARFARVHQRQVFARQEAVIDQAVFFHRQPRVASFQVAGAVTRDPKAQGEVLGTRRRPDRIGLEEAQALDRARQRGRLEQRAGDGLAAQRVEGGIGHVRDCSTARHASSCDGPWRWPLFPRGNV